MTRYIKSIICLLLLTGPGRPNLQAAQTIQVHLPREIEVQSSTITLGQICILRGPQDQVDRLRNISMGQLFSPNQTFVVNRPMILSRLASQGFDHDSLKITGAEQVTIHRDSQVLSGEDLIEQARHFLLERLPYLVHCVLEPVRQPGDLTVSSADQNIRIEPVLLSNPQSKQLRVRMVLRAGLEKLDRTDVIFQVRYQTGQLVATAPIPRGGVLTPENVTLKQGLTDRPEEVITTIPYGRQVQTAIDPNTVIKPQWLIDPQPPVLLKRNSNVVIQVKLPGLHITAMGTALDEGRNGDLIKVRNNDSRRVILCKVNPDGSAEPVL